MSQEIIDLVIRFKKENPHWGYTQIRNYIVHLRYKIGETTVRASNRMTSIGSSNK